MIFIILDFLSINRGGTAVARRRSQSALPRDTYYTRSRWSLYSSMLLVRGWANNQLRLALPDYLFERLVDCSFPFFLNIFLLPPFIYIVLIYNIEIKTKSRNIFQYKEFKTLWN